MKKLFKKVVFGRFGRHGKEPNVDHSGLGCSDVIVNQHVEDEANKLYDISEDQLQNLEYEEITLYRAHRSKKLGLTLWYENDGDVETNIFVSKIEAKSLVDLDGRIHLGDQLLQICGMDVHTKNQAVELLTHCNKIVKFLVARNLPIVSSTAAVSTASLPPLHHEITKLDCRNVPRIGQIKEEGESEFSSCDVNTVVMSLEKDSGISRLTDDSGANHKSRKNQDDAQSHFFSQETKNLPLKHLSVDDVACGLIEQRANEALCSSRQSSQIVGGQFSSENSIFIAAYPTNCYSSNQMQCSSKEKNLLAKDLLNLRREMLEMQAECDRLLAVGAFVGNQATAALADAPSSEGRRRSTASVSVQFPPLPEQKENFFLDEDCRSSTKCEACLENSAVGVPAPATSSSAYNTGNDSYPSSAPLTPQQAATTGKIIEEKIYINNCQDDTKVFQSPPTPQSLAVSENSRLIGTTQSTPNVSKIMLPGEAPSQRGVIWKKSHRGARDQAEFEATLSGSFSGNDKKIPVTIEGTKPSGHRHTVSISQPSVFRSDRKLFERKSSNEKPILADAANLGKTILLQQRLIRQAMIRQAYQLKAQQENAWNKSANPADLVLKQALTSPYGHFEPTTLPPAGQFALDRRKSENCSGIPPKIEWKLKKRADGSRYLSSRVIRRKILKDRAYQLNALRTGISSADDDMCSELKIGRYWTREERKKHVEKSKDRKKRIEEMFQKRVESLAMSSEQTVLRLSQQKLHRRQGFELLDHFTTIQEYLSRDTRTLQNKQSLGLLTVTTV